MYLPLTSLLLNMFTAPTLQVYKEKESVGGNYMDVPPQIRELNNVLDISVDIMFSNGLVFFLTSSQNVKFLTGESISSRKKPS